MRRTPNALAMGALAAMAVIALVPAALTAQLSVRDVSLSADTIDLGDRFELRFTVVLPPGQVLFLPDSIEAPGFESFGEVEWSAQGGSDGATELAIVYPLIAFQVGPVTVPDIDVFAGSAEESVAAGLSEPGATVGSWESFAREPGRVPSLRIATVPAERVQVRSVLVIDEMTDGIRPRPPADVMGGDRHWPSTVLALLFGAVLVGALTVAAREWRTAAAQRRLEASRPDPRTVAITALDQLLAEGLHRAGRVRDFYDRSSTIVRRYVEGLETGWGPAWTSTELMTDLERRARERAGRLPAEMSSAERVKFAGDRPDSEVAESHWSAVRTWVSTTGPDEPTSTETDA